MRLSTGVLTLLLPLAGLLPAQTWEVGGSAGYGLYRDVSVTGPSAAAEAANASAAETLAISRVGNLVMAFSPFDWLRMMWGAQTRFLRFQRDGPSLRPHALAGASVLASGRCTSI